MPYHEHFVLADDMIAHLDSVVENVVDPFIASRYVGFVAVAAVTVYELAIKDVFIDFGAKKHKVFGVYAQSNFNRINGRIKLGHLRDDYIRSFGERYKKRFDAKLEDADGQAVRTDHISIRASYSNIITWRNSFAHEGILPTSPTYAEVTTAYRYGKRVIDCLADAMTR